MTLKARLDRLEAAVGGEAGWSDYVKPTTGELLGDLEDAFRLPRGHISRTAEEASAKGHSCVAAEMAATLGMTTRALHDLFAQAAAEGEGKHEYRWVGAAFPKRCQIREVRQ